MHSVQNSQYYSILYEGTERNGALRRTIHSSCRFKGWRSKSTQNFWRVSSPREFGEPPANIREQGSERDTPQARRPSSKSTQNRLTPETLAIQAASGSDCRCLCMIQKSSQAFRDRELPSMPGQEIDIQTDPQRRLRQLHISHRRRKFL